MGDKWHNERADCARSIHRIEDPNSAPHHLVSRGPVKSPIVQADPSAKI